MKHRHTFGATKRAALTSCEWCGKRLPETGQLKRFCDRSCSANWRMRQPSIVARVHTDEVHAKIGAKISTWLGSGSPSARKQIERIRKLNPSARPEVRAKVSATLRRIGHKPTVRGGNGKGPTIPQRALHEALGEGWYMEYAVSLGFKRAGYPTSYKLDIANPSLMVGVEVDGSSHRIMTRRGQDQKKDSMLASLGWRVVRFTNEVVMASVRAVADEITAGLGRASA